ncbi:putative reverse transcriptase domain-containing protein [Tanacetum coccineum]
MSMTIHFSIKARILEAQSEVSKNVNTPAEMLKGLDKQLERKEDGGLYLAERIWVPVYGNLRTLIMNKAHATRYSVHPGADKMYYDLRDLYWWPGMKKDISIDTEYGCALYESVVRLCMRLLWLTVNRNNATYCASVEDIAVQYCFFDILLTSLSPRNCIPPEVLLRVSMHSACSTSENALEKPLDIRKLDNSSYQALGACFKPYKAFLKR